MLQARVVEVAVQALQACVPVVEELAGHMSALEGIPVAGLHNHLQCHIQSQRRSQLGCTRKTACSSLVEPAAVQIGSSTRDLHTEGSQTKNVPAVRSLLTSEYTLQDQLASEVM